MLQSPDPLNIQKETDIVEKGDLDNNGSRSLELETVQEVVENSDGRDSTSELTITPLDYLEVEDEDELFTQTLKTKKGENRIIEANLGFDDDDEPQSVRRRDARGIEAPTIGIDDPITSDEVAKCNLDNFTPVDILNMEETDDHPLDGLNISSWIGEYQEQWNENVLKNSEDVPHALNPEQSYSRLLMGREPSDSDAESVDTQASLESGTNTWKVGDTLGEIDEIDVPPPNINQPKPANPSSGIFSRLFRAKDVNRTRFEKYAHDLRSCIDDMEQGINDCQSQIKAIKKEMRKETKKWRRYAQVTMENMARTYFENRLLYVNSRIQLFARRLEVLNGRLNQVQQVLDGKDMNTFNIEWFGDDGELIPPNALPLPADAIDLTESCLTMEGVVADLRSQYTELKKQSLKKKSKEERKPHFEKELDIAYKRRQHARHATEESKFHWHPAYVEGTQLNFNCLVLDQRYSPGVLLHRWYSKIEKQPEVEPTSITSFIDYLATYLISHYKLDPKYYQTIVLFLERLIFPRIMTANKKPLFRSQMTEKEIEQDQLFRSKATWLRQLSQENIGINPKFCKKDIDESNLETCRKADVPFGPCIEALVGEARVQVPTDILQNILQAIRKINSCAQSYCNNNNENKEIMIGADDLFPMVVYVVVHSKVRDINARLGFLERYVKHAVKYFGEAALCLSLLQAAVAYISSREPKDFGL